MKPDIKISRSRTQLLLHHPFLGTLALAMKVKDGTGMGVKTMAVDGKHLFYNPEYVDGLSLTDLNGVISHEIMHLVYLHVIEWRKANGRKEPHWTLAQEQVVNDAVLNMFGKIKIEISGKSSKEMVPSCTLPGKPFYEEKYKGMYTEEVYAHLLRDDPDMKQNQISMGGGQGQGQSEQGDDQENTLDDVMVDQHGIGNLTADEIDEIKSEMPMKIAQAAQAAKTRGKLPSDLERLVGEMLDPKIPWQRALAEYIMPFGKNDFTMRRPNRRHLYRGVVLPSLRSETLEIACVFDTSGSITEEEMTEFYSELKGIMHAFPSYKIHLIGCGASVHGYEVAEPWSEPDMADIYKGGGGTDFRPPFEKLDEEGIRPQALVYFTDAYGEFPEDPGYPVLWVVKGCGEVPWGRRLEL